MAKKDASTAGSPKGRSWLSTTILVALIALAAEPYLRSNEATNNSVHGFAVVDSKGTSSPLGDLISGKAALLVNVASACGLTPQYAGLESLYRKYKDQGFTIVGFPCNQFGAQEPGTMGEILDFCKSKFDVTFPVMAKIDVNGENEHPLYTFMKKEKPSVGGISKIEWNFAKFLVDKNGRVVERFLPTTTPDMVAPYVESLLSGQADSSSSGTGIKAFENFERIGRTVKSLLGF